MRKEKIWRELKNSEFTRICVEDHSSVIGWQELLLLFCFFHTNPFNFRWPLQLILLRYKAKNLQVT